MGGGAKKTITGRRKLQQQRRFKAAELFASGSSRAEVAAQLGVSWRAAHGWWQEWQASGISGLETKGKPGPLPKFNDLQVEELRGELIMGALAHGYSNDIWTLRRVAQLIHDRFGLKASPSEVWRLLKRMGWSTQ